MTGLKIWKGAVQERLRTTTSPCLYCSPPSLSESESYAANVLKADMAGFGSGFGSGFLVSANLYVDVDGGAIAVESNEALMRSCSDGVDIVVVSTLLTDPE